ncbi:FtsX-like permease family protein [compost metagenome]
MALTCIGLLLGLALGHTAGALARDAVFTQTGIQLQAFVLATNEWMLIAAALLIGVLASLVPALKVYRTNALSLFRH